MYILRHPAGNLGPLSVARAPGGAGKLERLATPGPDGTLLRVGADCIDLHITDAPVTLVVTAFLPHAGAPVPALRVDQVGLAPAHEPQPASAAPIVISQRGLSLIGEVDTLGLAVAAPGAILGRPADCLPLAGFQLMWPDQPADVELSYGVTMEDSSPTPMVSTGAFCGVRGGRGRITACRFSLSGPGAATCRLEGSAWFSGGFTTPVVAGALIRGPSGLEHLTGLSLKAVAPQVSLRQLPPRFKAHTHRSNKHV